MLVNEKVKQWLDQLEEVRIAGNLQATRSAQTVAMEVVVTEEKKKIFRARKTMKISDRQQLETLHSTLLTSSGLSSSPPPPLVNGTHKEDGPKLGDKEVDLESNSPNASSPTSQDPCLSLNLSSSPATSRSSNTKEEPSASPGSPFHSLNSELKKLENDEKTGSLAQTSNKSDTPVKVSEKVSEKKQENSNGPVTERKEVENEREEGPAALNSGKNADRLLSGSPVELKDYSEPMETESNTSKAINPEATADKKTDRKAPSPKSTNSIPPYCPSTSSTDTTDVEQEIKKEIKVDKTTNQDFKKEPFKGKLDMGVKVETKKEKSKVSKQSRPSSTPPSNSVKEEKSSTSGLKRTRSEGFDGHSGNKEVKKPKRESEEFEQQLEFKITAKGGTHHKLEKIVQKLVDERLRGLELTIFNQHFQELKTRVDKIECAKKHQNAINTLQVKLARLAKKFGEANQASENKRKHEALVAAVAAVNATNTTPASTGPVAKTVSSSPQIQWPARSSVEVKQTTTTAVPLTSTAAAVTTAPSISAPVSTSTALVPQTPILQLIASTSNAVSNLTTAITTQSSTGTLLLKTAPGSGMMTAGQPLLIQLPLSMANGQTGTLVNIPVSLPAGTSLNKAKTTAPTTTFIIKPALASTTVASSASTAATVPALQAPASQVSTQISLARTVYQGGAGGITTPNAGVSVTTARAPAQPVSVAGAMSSTSSPVTSGPAATGSTAPGPPQGTSLTTKTDNQATGSTPSKVAAPTARPKGSVIDLTEEDDDVLVTGVKSATVTTSSATQRPQTSIPTAARSSPQTNPNSTTTNSQLSSHHRPLLDSTLKSRTTTTTGTPTRTSSVALPPLPSAPVPPRLPPEAEKTSPPQQPQLKLVPSQTGIVLSWCVAETDLTCAAVDSYHLYAFHQDNSNSNPAQQHWKKIGEVKALPLPMACTLTQFQSGSTYHFAVRAKDIYGRFGAFCDPQCTNVISSSSS